MSLINLNELKFTNNKNIYFVLFELLSFNNNYYYIYYLYQYENIDLFNNIIIFPFINSNNDFLKENIYNFIKKYKLQCDIKGSIEYDNDIYVFLELNEKIKIDLKSVTLYEICNLKKYFTFDINEKVYNLFFYNNFLLTLNNDIITYPYIGFFDNLNNNSISLNIYSNNNKDNRYLFFIKLLNYNSNKNIFYNNDFEIKKNKYIFKNFDNLLKIKN
jgi:hypothetical protein